LILLEKSSRNVELDLWIPKYKIGVEYQGEPIELCFIFLPFFCLFRFYLIIRRTPLFQYRSCLRPEWYSKPLH
jgi:hypothetical protein